MAVSLVFFRASVYVAKASESEPVLLEVEDEPELCAEGS